MKIIDTVDASSKEKSVAVIGSPDLEFYGGTQVNVLQLANFLSQSGYRVTIYGSGTYFKRREVELGNNIRYFPHSFRFDPFSWEPILKASSGISEPLIGMFTSRKVAKTVGTFDIYYFTAPKFVMYALSKHVIRDVPLIIGNHGTYIEYLSSKSDFLSKSLLNLFDSIFLKYVGMKNTFIHAQNNLQMEHYIKRGIDAKKIFVIPQCDVDFSLYSVKDNDKFRVVFLNRLSSDKGADFIAEIAKRCEEIDFIVIGDGPLRNRLDERCGPNVKLTGFLSESAKNEELGNCDAMINLSKYESLSISSIEGIASGLTVISRNSTSGLNFIHEKIPESVLFADGTVESTCCVIKQIKNEKDSDRKKFVEKKLKIRSKGEAVFDKKVIIGKMVELFKTVQSLARA